MYLSASQVLNIPQADLPLAVLSDNLQSWFSTAIKKHEKGFYNHFMWMHRPGLVATQGWTFREEPIEKYLLTHRLKFWTSNKWSPEDKAAMRLMLSSIAKLPAWQRMYDPLQIVGKWLGIDWLQIPGSMRICSDYGDILALDDPDWKKSQHLSPPEINRAMMESDRYQVYGRYAPD